MDSEEAANEILKLRLAMLAKANPNVPGLAGRPSISQIRQMPAYQQGAVPAPAAPVDANAAVAALAQKQYGQAAGNDAANMPTWARNALRQRVLASQQVAQATPAQPFADSPEDTARKAAMIAAANAAQQREFPPQNGQTTKQRVAAVQNDRMAQPEYQAAVKNRRALGSAAADEFKRKNIQLAEARGVLNPSAQQFWQGKQLAGKDVIPNYRQQAIDTYIASLKAQHPMREANPKDEAIGKLLNDPHWGPIIASGTQITPEMMAEYQARTAGPVATPPVPASTPPSFAMSNPSLATLGTLASVAGPKIAELIGAMSRRVPDRSNKDLAAEVTGNPITSGLWKHATSAMKKAKKIGASVAGM